MTNIIFKGDFVNLISQLGPDLGQGYLMRALNEAGERLDEVLIDSSEIMAVKMCVEDGESESVAIEKHVREKLKEKLRRRGLI